MLNRYIFPRYFEVSNGKKLATLIEDLGGPSARSFRGGSGGPSKRSTWETWIEKVQQRIRRQMRNSGVTETAIEERLQLDPYKKSPHACYASLIYHSETELNKFPKSIKYANSVDDLSLQIDHARQNLSFVEFKEMLLDDKRIVDLHGPFNLLSDHDIRKGGTRDFIESANTQTQLERAVYPIAINALFSVMAHWDVEFSQSYFPFTPLRSSFAMVTPKLRPGVKLDEFDKPDKQRNSVWLPIRRLIDFMACAGQYDGSNTSFPDKVPSFANIAHEILLPDETDDVLKKWRGGTKRFTMHDFYRLYEGLFTHFTDENGKMARLPPPESLAHAAIMWQMLFVKMNKKRSKILYDVLVDDDYKYWWDRQLSNMLKSSRSKKIAREENLLPWPKCFAEI